MTEAKTPAADAAPKKAKTPAADAVRVRVIKKGDGKIHDGAGDRYAKGDEFEIGLNIAASLEDAGLVDVL